MNTDTNVIGWLRALCEEIGGAGTYEAAMDYYGGGASLAELAQQLGRPRATLHRHLTRVWRRLERCNALPPTWRIPRGRGRPKSPVICTDRELFIPVSQQMRHFAGEGEDMEL